MTFIRFCCFSIAIGLLWSCQKDEEYPPEPIIEFSDLVFLNNDSSLFKLNFTDGDGDIGLAQGDTFPPFDDASKYYTNIFITYKFWDTASLSWEYFYLPPVPPSTDSTKFSYNYRIPRITNIGQNKTLKGEIIVALPGKGLLYIAGHTRFKYECFIVDRALHESNLVETPEYIP